MSDLPPLLSGIYRHYKGPLYLVLGYGHDANDDDRDVVVYVGLQLDGAKRGARLACRTASDFEAVLHVDDATVCEDPKFCGREQTLRFTYLGPALPV